jgi:hypothetical protein
MDFLRDEIMNGWDKDPVTINDGTLDPFDLTQQTKEILATVGLPMNAEEMKEDPFYIHFYNEPRLAQGGDYIILGDNEGSEIGIYVETGELYFLSADPVSVQRRFINSDIGKFLMFLKIYLRYRPQLVNAMECEDDEEKRSVIVNEIKRQFNQADSKALSDEESYWSVILEQVEEGLSC